MKSLLLLSFNSDDKFKLFSIQGFQNNDLQMDKRLFVSMAIFENYASTRWKIVWECKRQYVRLSWLIRYDLRICLMTPWESHVSTGPESCAFPFLGNVSTYYFFVDIFRFLNGIIFCHSKIYLCNRPWRPVGLWDVEAPTFSRPIVFNLSFVV
jgi:hypothetical protein